MIRLRSASFGETGLRLRSASFGGAGLRLRTLVTALATAAAVVIGGGTDVFACPACFGAEEAPLIDAAKLGVLVMLGITLAVQGGFVTFFVYLRRRAKRAADEELDTEWSELQRPSRTS